jgi:hypothetical protein
MNYNSPLKILNRFFKIAAPTFLLLTFSFEVSSTGEVSILWRDATMLALTFTVIAAGMTLGWVVHIPPSPSAHTARRGFLVYHQPQRKGTSNRTVQYLRQKNGTIRSSSLGACGVPYIFYHRSHHRSHALGTLPNSAHDCSHSDNFLWLYVCKFYSVWTQEILARRLLHTLSEYKHICRPVDTNDC